MKGYEHLLDAIEKCTNMDLLIDLLNLVARPLQMMDSNWAMSYILRIFTALKTSKTDSESLSYDKGEKEFRECIESLKNDIFSRSKGFNLEIE